MPQARHPAGRKYHAVILCCGHMDRGDDAVGPLCAAALADRRIPAQALGGGASELLEAWRQARHVIVVDAISSGAVPAGSLHRMAAGEAAFHPDYARCSAPGTGLSQACRLAGVLRCMPETLILMGLEGAQFEWAATQSPEVAAAMPALVDAVEREWRRLIGLKKPTRAATAPSKSAPPAPPLA